PPAEFAAPAPDFAPWAFSHAKTGICPAVRPAAPVALIYVSGLIMALVSISRQETLQAPCHAGQEKISPSGPARNLPPSCAPASRHSARSPRAGPCPCLPARG